MRAASRIGTVFSLLGALVATSMIMGLLVAGIAIPAVGAAGQATRSSVELFNQLPGDFEMNPLAQQSRILASDGSVIATPFNENRIVVPLNKISKYMQQAQVAIEDSRFYEHGALDTRGITRAIASNIFSSGTQGASTLTQQYVKVALQDQAVSAGDTAAAQNAVTQSGMKGYVRKLQQLKYAVSLEQKYSKDQILDGYLNIVYYGDQMYGIEAAARHYFGVPAEKLTLPEAALLAGVVNQPGVTDPVNNPQASMARRNVVLQKMKDQGMITQAQMEQAQATNVKDQLKLTPVGTSCAYSKYPYFCNYVTDWLMTQPALGKTARERKAKLQSGGLTVQTAFNPKNAAIIDKQIRAKVPQGNTAGLSSAGIMIQPGTGLVLGSGQNTSFSNTEGTGKTATNLTVASAGSRGFDFGSTAKLFAIVTALQSGMPVNATVNVPPMNGVSPGGDLVHKFTAAQFPGKCGAPEGWPVENDVQVPVGPMSLTKATAGSVNTAFATLAMQLGVCKIRDTMINQFHLTQGNGDALNPTPSGIVLGTNTLTPIDLTNAYATIAAGGKWCQPHPVSAIKDSSGKSLPLTGTSCKQVMSKDVAAATAKIFESVLEPGGTGATSKLADGRIAAGKTGTETGARNIWFVGFTPQLATGVWVGHAKDPADIKNVTLAGRFYKGYVFAGDLAAPLWKAIMDDALKGQPKVNFPDPSAKVLQGSQVTVPNVVGQSVGTATSMLQAAGFTVTVGGTQSSSMFAGLIASSSPSGSAPKGANITIYPSSGQPAYTPPPVRQQPVAPTRAPVAPTKKSTPKPSTSSTNAAPPTTKAAPTKPGKPKSTATPKK